MISNDAIGQVTVQILAPLNLYRILLKRKLKLRRQNELKNVVDEAGSNLSINVETDRIYSHVVSSYSPLILILTSFIWAIRKYPRKFFFIVFWIENDIRQCFVVG